MAFFSCSISFQSDRTFEDLEEELSHRYLGGLRFIPADRRDARDFTRAEFAEYPFFNHEIDLTWNEDYPKYFGVGVQKHGKDIWFRDPQEWAGWMSGSLERCLGVLLRQIDGVHDIQIHPGTAGPYLDVWQTKVRLLSRLTVQEVGAQLAQKLFCGFRFVPVDASTMRDASVFHTEHDLLGHRITLSNIVDLDYHELSIEPSAQLLQWLTSEETMILRGLDIRPWILAPFQNHGWIRAGNIDDDDFDEVK